MSGKNKVLMIYLVDEFPEGAEASGGGRNGGHTGVLLARNDACRPMNNATAIPSLNMNSPAVLSLLAA
jgi:hypothetical protein